MNETIKNLKRVLEQRHLTTCEYFQSGDEIPYIIDEIVNVSKGTLFGMLNTAVDMWWENDNLIDLKRTIDKEHVYIKKNDGENINSFEVEVVVIHKRELFDMLDQFVKKEEKHNRNITLDNGDVLMYVTDR